MHARLEGNPDWYDAKAAGWWVWGMALWIGGGFCAGSGPWVVEGGQLIHVGDAAPGIQRQRIHVGDAGRGIQRKLIHVGNAGQGIQRQRIHVGDAGRGIQRQLIHVGNAGQGGLYSYLRGLAERTARVRVACGDWQRVIGPSVTTNHGLTGVYLDPPYRFTGRHAELYGAHESASVFDETVAWALAHGADPLLRIALSGYGDEDVMAAFAEAGWSALRWKAKKGYGGQRKGNSNENRNREVVWFSPQCLSPIAQELSLWSLAEGGAV